MINKIHSITNTKSFIPKKTIAGTLIAGSLLGGMLTSCNNKPDSFKKEKIECVAADKITDSISVKTLPAKKQASISNLSISNKTSHAWSLGKSIGAGLLGGLIGGLVGIFRKDKSFLTTGPQCAAVGAAAGLLLPGLAMGAIITLFAALVGGAAGTMFSGGDDKIGKATAALFGIIAAAASLSLL